MSRTPLPFHAQDISALARSLKTQLATAEQPPGHLALLNMLARSAGARNFQHLRAQGLARERLEAPAEPPPAVDAVMLERLVRHFDADGRMLRWPPRASQVEPCLWVLWSRLPARLAMTEREIGERLGRLHVFGDHALLRRALADYGLVTRTADGGEYRRVESAPQPLALALIRRVAAKP